METDKFRTVNKNPVELPKTVDELRGRMVDLQFRAQMWAATEELAKEYKTEALNEFSQLERVYMNHHKQRIRGELSPEKGVSTASLRVKAPSDQEPSREGGPAPDAG